MKNHLPLFCLMKKMKSGMTQYELASRSGTTRNYISRIEYERSDIEIATLRKIVETGLYNESKIGEPANNIYVESVPYHFNFHSACHLITGLLSSNSMGNQM